MRRGAIVIVVRAEIERALNANDGVASRDQLLQVCRRATVDEEVRRRRIVAIFPRAYARPWDVDVSQIRLRAALASVGGEVALSHLTALRLSSLPAPAEPLHVTAFQPRHPRGVPGELTVHRTLLPLRAVWTQGLPVVTAAVAAVTSWPLLVGADQRAPMIEGARRGLMNPAELWIAVDKAGRMRGIAALRALVGQIAAGCESELELFGYRNVFDFPGLRHGVRQRVLRARGRTFRVDLAFDEERLAIELDGRQFHASPQQWQRDIDRDLAGHDRVADHSSLACAPHRGRRRLPTGRACGPCLAPVRFVGFVAGPTRRISPGYEANEPTARVPDDAVPAGPVGKVCEHTFYAQLDVR